jgi:hypothetical protein
MWLAVRIPELNGPFDATKIFLNGIAMDYPRVSTINDSYKML